jgi:hypothetical protein
MKSSSGVGFWGARVRALALAVNQMLGAGVGEMRVFAREDRAIAVQIVQLDSDAPHLLSEPRSLLGLFGQGEIRRTEARGLVLCDSMDPADCQVVTLERVVDAEQVRYLDVMSIVHGKRQKVGVVRGISHETTAAVLRDEIALVVAKLVP